MKKILVVEDEGELRELICFSLNRKGFNTLEAKDGQEALDIIQKNQDISIVLTDVNMPKGMGGEELTHRLVEMKAPQDVYLMSGYLGNQKLENFPGVKKFYRKPLKINELIEDFK